MCTLKLCLHVLRTSYVAKISENEVGSEIWTKHRLTQGKNSSASLFSYYISDMPDSISNIKPADFFDPLNLFQVADDSTPDLSTLVISADTEVDPVSTDKRYCWLGFWLSYADNVPSLIKYNISKEWMASSQQRSTYRSENQSVVWMHVCCYTVQ